jgi:anti-sigma factor RsiW
MLFKRIKAFLVMRRQKRGKLLSQEAKQNLFGFGVMLLMAAFDGEISDEERAELREFLEQSL